MIYVKERNADSICDTALEFFVMNSEYIPTHCDGRDKTSAVLWVACLYMATAAVQCRWVQGQTWC